MSTLVVVGDTLLDRDLVGRAARLSPDAPVPVVEDATDRCRPGGAGLAALLAARDGWDVTLITALAPDEEGERLRNLLDAAGVQVEDLGRRGATPRKTRIRADGHAVARLDQGCGRLPVGELTPTARLLLDATPGVLVADYAQGLTDDADLRSTLSARRAPTVWDPHPRGAVPVAGVRVVTPNAAEALALADGPTAPDRLADHVTAARALAERWRSGVAVTRSARGAVFVDGPGAPLVVPCPAPATGDPCGAGDRFATTVAQRLAEGALPAEAVTEAVPAATAFIAAGGVAALDRPPMPPVRHPGPPADAEARLAAIRARGGTVVATGGCFDLLHAGHVGLLEGARALGDALVVCLNSDESVQALKGPGRPIVPAADRRRVLLGLHSVDAVVEFDEPTPLRLLDRLRPDLFVKGGDYRLTDLPEADLLEGWGGEVVLLPYLDGRSTTRLTEEAARAHR